MAAGKSISLFLVFLASTTVFSYSYVREASGRRLFGGYRIVPKTCKPTIPSRVKSNEPAICMFNYECTRRNGEVVGACMDGFLFGACCQLPSKSSINDGLEKITSMSEILNPHEIDHVPDIPILLNPDGTPVGMKIPQNDDINKEGTSSVSKRPTTEETIYTKISTFGASSTTSKPILGPSYSMDSVENAEKPQIPVQPDLSNLEQNFSALLDQQSILDDLSLPSLLSHSDSNNYIQDHQENSPVNPVTTLLSPDEILQIADPVDQLPALFSQGFGQSNYSSADTILLNKNGSVLNEAQNPDDLFKPTAQTIAHSTEKNRITQSFGTSEKGGVTESGASTENKKKVTLDANHRDTSTTQWVRFPEQQRPSGINSMTTFGGSFGGFPTTKLPMITQMYGNSQGIATVSPESLSTMFDKFEKISTIEERVSTKNVEALYSPGQRTTTPMSTLSDKKEDLVRVPTITYDAPSGNKKHDIVDKEEIAINHIISILNDTTPGSDNSVTVQAPSSPIHTWVSIDELSKPTLIRLSSSRPTPPTSVATQSFPYTFYKPNQPTNYYNYETVPTETSYSSHSTSNTYPPRPSTQTNFGSSQSNFGYSTRPTTNPPAPTVIVLGPLGTEYTTETTEKSVVTRKPTTEPVRLSSTAVRPTVGSIRPSSVSTKKPSVSTTITHNISTVISNVATNNNHVVSSSFISVNLKDGSTSKPTVSTAISTEAVSDEENEERITTKKPVVWTTLSSWSDKPLFQLKPSTSTFRWPEENPTASDSVIFGDSESAGFKATTSTPPCDDETAAPDDLINFPPVRNPNLNISAPISQQEKPIMMQTFNDTRYPDVDIISENDIPTPTFIEDDVLTNKVDAFVNKLVESLQGNFQDLKDVVYKRNGTTTTSPTTVTKRPTVTRKPTQKPTQTAKPPNTTTRRPVTTRRPATRPASSKPTSEKPPRTSKPTTSKPRPTTSYGVTTKKPQVTTKRSKPTKKPTTTTTRSTEALLFEEEATSPLTTVEDVNASSQATPTVDFRNQCGVRPLAKSGRIVGGKAASFGKWPWQVLVREATWLGLFTKNKCGGVLITDKYVITAAHCQPGFLASLVAVFGEFDLSGELEEKRSMTRNVRRVIVNRGYDPATFESDLALLELESPVQFDEHIVPICMPDDNIDFTGRMATVTGWGRLKYNGGVPFLLQEVQVPIIKNSVCQEMFQIAGHSKLIVDSFLCAGYADGQKDSCEGDSGGPLVMQRPDGRWFLVGTVSHGIKCASPFLPGVYMRINYFKPWLHSVTGV